MASWLAPLQHVATPKHIINYDVDFQLRDNTLKRVHNTIRLIMRRPPMLVTEGRLNAANALKLNVRAGKAAPSREHQLH